MNEVMKQAHVVRYLSEHFMLQLCFNAVDLELVLICFIRHYILQT